MRARCALGLMVLSWAQPALACAVFVAPGQAAPAIQEEQALIVWDEAAKREHFVRTLSFARTDGSVGPPPAVGFVVPTPSVPEIAEVNDPALFVRLAHASAPRFEQITERRWSFLPAFLAFSRASKAGVEVAAAPSQVEVVGRTHVAGLDAVSLRADDPSALGAWLREHGFESRPSIAAWLAPYVEKHWIVNAFRYAPGDAANANALHTHTIRLSFDSPQPLWPYREPDDAVHGSSRFLRVYLVANERRTAVVESGATRGEVEFAGPIEANVLGDAVPAFKRAAFLTTLEDRALRRDGGDLLFPVAPTQEPFRRVDRILTYDTVSVPIDLVALPIVACAVVLVLRRRKPA